MSDPEKTSNTSRLGTTFGLFVFRLFARLPYPLLVIIGKSLGQLSYWLMRRRRSIASTNIKLCFPELSRQHQRQLVRESFQSVGISLFETALAWWASDEKLEPLCHIEGLEHLHAAQRQQHGILLLSAHFTSLEIGGRLLSKYVDFAVMYKPHRNLVMELAIKSAREKHYQHAISQDNLRDFIRALKKQTICWYAPDQDLGIHRGVFAPFFGIPAATITAPSRFAKMTQAVVVPFFATRRKDNRGYDLKLLPALSEFPSPDPVVDATRINHIIETQARQTPGQYLWQHRRFKTRPAGEDKLYEQ